jgi:hypothetical protein
MVALGEEKDDLIIELVNYEAVGRAAPGFARVC